MEKQNLFSALSSVKDNNLKKNEVKIDKFGKIYESADDNQELDFNVSAIDSVSEVTNPTTKAVTVGTKLFCKCGPIPKYHENESIIDELFEKNKILQARWKAMQGQMDNLKRENESLNKLLSEERARTSKYQTKLRYIQENQKVFEKLKQAYLNLKYNEQRPNVEVKEGSCQTCYEYQEPEKLDTQEKHKLNEEVLDILIEPGYMPVKKNEFNGLKETVQTLKTLIISQPLSTFVISENREAKYRKDISELFMENRTLKQLVVDQQLELDSAKQQIEIRKSSKEINMMKKIIAKLERQIRSCNKCTDIISHEDSKTYLNETETKIVEHISYKYEFKLQQKYEDTDPKTPKTPKTPKSATPFYTPRSARTDGADTFRSCENDDSFDSKSF